MCENEPAKFTIKLSSGNPRPTCKWFKEEKEINISESNDSYEAIEETDNTYSFIIKSTKTTDTGRFIAKLTNEAGSVNSNKATLTVKSKPLFQRRYYF